MKKCEEMELKDMERWKHGNLEFGEIFDDMDIYIDCLKEEAEKAKTLFQLAKVDVELGENEEFARARLKYAKQDLENINSRIKKIYDMFERIIS